MAPFSCKLNIMCEYYSKSKSFNVSSFGLEVEIFLDFIIKFNCSLRLLRALRLLISLASLFFFLMLTRKDIYIEWLIFQTARSKVLLVLILDMVSLLFLITVILISIAVIFFRTRYIANEKFFSRFLFLVLSFVCRILLLILSPNRIRILLGWDGLGVTSYLLVIYYQRNKSYNAGIITALTNRLGDVGLLLCLALFVKLGTWNFYLMFPSAEIFLILLILVCARITKSAQIPFSAWLPAAIAAPTPVSALVHSSTLVTAGVYLLIRFNYLLISFNLLKYLILIGVFTIFIAGLGAMRELDMKKVIALSTLRQLGVIIITIGVGFPLIRFFHLVAHAFFKALLFICAGILIHNFKDYQDIRLMSRGGCFMPFTLRIFITANLRLCGLPFMAGFYSKDLILEIFIISRLNMFIFIIIILSTALTVIYSCRLAFLLGANNFKGETLSGIIDFDPVVVVGFFFLFFPSIFGGLVGSWVFYPVMPVIFFPLILKRLIFILVLTRAFRMLRFMLDRARGAVSNLKRHLNSKIWFLPLVARAALSYGTLIRGKSFRKIREIGWNERLLYRLIFKLLTKRGPKIEKILIVSFSQRVIFSVLVGRVLLLSYKKFLLFLMLKISALFCHYKK